MSTAKAAAEHDNPFAKLEKYEDVDSPVFDFLGYKMRLTYMKPRPGGLFKEPILQAYSARHRFDSFKRGFGFSLTFHSRGTATIRFTNNNTNPVGMWHDVVSLPEVSIKAALTAAARTYRENQNQIEQIGVTFVESATSDTWDRITEATKLCDVEVKYAGAECSIQRVHTEAGTSVMATAGDTAVEVVRVPEGIAVGGVLVPDTGAGLTRVAIAIAAVLHTSEAAAEPDTAVNIWKALCKHEFDYRFRSGKFEYDVYAFSPIANENKIVDIILQIQICGTPSIRRHTVVDGCLRFSGGFVTWHGDPKRPDKRFRLQGVRNADAWLTKTITELGLIPDVADAVAEAAAEPSAPKSMTPELLLARLRKLDREIPLSNGFSLDWNNNAMWLYRRVAGKLHGLAYWRAYQDHQDGGLRFIRETVPNTLGTTYTSSFNVPDKITIDQFRKLVEQNFSVSSEAAAEVEPKHGPDAVREEILGTCRRGILVRAGNRTFRLKNHETRDETVCIFTKRGNVDVLVASVNFPEDDISQSGVGADIYLKEYAAYNGGVRSPREVFYDRVSSFKSFITFLVAVLTSLRHPHDMELEALGAAEKEHENRLLAEVDRLLTGKSFFEIGKVKMFGHNFGVRFMRGSRLGSVGIDLRIYVDEDNSDLALAFTIDVPGYFLHPHESLSVFCQRYFPHGGSENRDVGLGINVLDAMQMSAKAFVAAVVKNLVKQEADLRSWRFLPETDVKAAAEALPDPAAALLPALKRLHKQKGDDAELWRGKVEGRELIISLGASDPDDDIERLYVSVPADAEYERTFGSLFKDLASADFGAFQVSGRHFHGFRLHPIVENATGVEVTTPSKARTLKELAAEILKMFHAKGYKER